MKDKTTELMDYYLRSLKRQEKRNEMMADSMNHFFEEGAPAKLKEGFDTISNKFTNAIDDVVGFDLSGISTSIVSNVSDIGKSFTQSFGKISLGMKNFLMKDPKESKTFYEQANDISMLTGHALKRGSIYTHDIHIEDLYKKSEKYNRKIFNSINKGITSLVYATDNAGGKLDIMLEYEKWKKTFEQVQSVLYGKKESIDKRQLNRLTDIRSILEKSFDISYEREGEDFKESFIYKMFGKKLNLKTNGLFEMFSPKGNGFFEKFTDNWAKDYNESNDLLGSLDKNISEVAAHALKRGSIYTHDIHTEGLLEKLFNLSWADTKERAKKRKDQVISAAKNGATGGLIVGGMYAGFLATMGPAMAAFISLGPILLGIAALASAFAFFTNSSYQKDVINLFNEFVTDFIPVFTDLMYTVMDTFSVIAQPVLTLVKNVLPMFGKLILSVVNLLKKSVLPLLEKLISFAVPIFSDIFNVVLNAIGIFIDAFSDFVKAITPVLDTWFQFDKEFIGSFVPIMNEFLGLAKIFFKELTGIVSSLASIYATLMKYVIPRLMPIFKLLLATFFMPLFFLFKYILRGFPFILRKSLKLLDYVLKVFFQFPQFFSMFAILADKIGVLTPTLNFISKYWTKSMEFFSFMIEWISSLNKIGKFVSKWILKPIKFIFNVFGVIGKFLGLFLKLSKILGWPIIVILSIFDFIKGFSEQEGNFFKKVFSGLYDIVWGIVGFPIELLDMSLQWLSKMLGVDTIYNTIRDFVIKFLSKDGLLSVISNIINSITNIYKEIYDSIKKMFNFDSILSIIGDMMFAPFKILLGAFKWLTDKFGLPDILGMIKDWLVSNLGGTWLGDKILELMGISQKKEMSYLDYRKDEREKLAKRLLDIQNRRENSADLSSDEKKKKEEEEKKARDEQKSTLDKLSDIISNFKDSASNLIVSNSANTNNSVPNIPTEPENMALLYKLRTMR